MIDSDAAGTKIIGFNFLMHPSSSLLENQVIQLCQKTKLSSGVGMNLVFIVKNIPVDRMKVHDS